MSARAWGSVILLILFVVFVTIVTPHWIHQRDVGNTVVASMDKCVEFERAKGHGQDHLDSTYRLCWMRAKSDASK